MLIRVIILLNFSLFFSYCSSQIEKDKNIVYGNAIDVKGKSIALLADIYTLENNKKLLPTFLFMHGGGFTSGSKSGKNVVAYCEDVARSGMVVISVNYRLGIKEPENGKNTIEAMLRAAEDAKKAINYFKANAAEWNIDTAHFYVGGASSGAIALNHAVFCDKRELDLIISKTKLSAQNYGYLMSNNVRVLGFVNLWGGILDTAFLSGHYIPVLCIHSKQDKVVPFKYKTNKKQTVALYGSYYINRFLSKTKVYTQLKLYDSNVHNYGLGEDALDITISETIGFFNHIGESSKINSD